MKIIFTLMIAIVLMAFHVLENNSSENNNAIAKQKAAAYKQQYAISCSPDFTLLNFNNESDPVPLLEGWGTYRMPVTYANDSAYIYFQQGINLYYAFHIIEALASFEKSISFDKNFAMAYWGKALAYGPNINDFDYHASPDAITAMHTAKELYQHNSPEEKALINAVQFRFSADSTKTADQLKLDYAAEMKKVYEQFPASADIAALYADALMVIHPWDLYDKDFNPKPWTPEIVSVLEKLVASHPEHPGASHYYIHAIEGSTHPEKGLVVANRLGGMMPGVAHLVHMPSHIYIRSGYYKKGVDVNVDAIKNFNNYAEKFPPSLGNAFLYYLHNAHMQATCANMDGRFAESLNISEDLKKNIDTSYLSAPGWVGTMVQYVYMTPVFTLIRFGKWDEILNYPMVDNSKIYAAVIAHYSKGLAFSHKKDFDKANEELAAMQALMMNSQMSQGVNNFNAAIAGASVGEKILQGTIALENKNTAKAIDYFKEAVENEDKMYYNEPRDWPHPARQYLGNAFFQAKDFMEAEKEFRKDLMINPNNGWSLTGLAACLKQLHKDKEATSVQNEAQKAFERSDIKITNAVF